MSCPRTHNEIVAEAGIQESLLHSLDLNAPIVQILDTCTASALCANNYIRHAGASLATLHVQTPFPLRLDEAYAMHALRQSSIQESQTCST